MMSGVVGRSVWNDRWLLATTALTDWTHLVLMHCDIMTDTYHHADGLSSMFFKWSSAIADGE